MFEVNNTTLIFSLLHVPQLHKSIYCSYMRKVALVISLTTCESVVTTCEGG